TSLSQVKGLKDALKAYTDGTISKARELKGKLEQEFSPALSDLNNHLGLCAGETFYNLVDMLIKKQLSKKLGREITEPVTFQQLKDAGFKDMYFAGVNTSTGLVEYFSYEDTPDMIVANAVRISMSIPGIFTPQPKIIKDHHGICHEGEDLYVDGGVLLNYPIKLFDFKVNEQGFLDRKVPKINKHTLGLRLSYPKKDNVKPSATTKPTLMSWLGGTIKNLGVNYQENDHFLNGDSFRTVYIDVPSIGVGTLDFERVEEEAVKQTLTQIGIAGVREFLGRTSQSKPLYVELPEALDKEYRAHLERIGYKLNGKPIYKLNRNCPKLVLAFYKSLDRKDLHKHLHDDLNVSLWARDDAGMSVFHMAVIHKEIDVLKYLLETYPNGAQAKNNIGKTPYQLAEESGQTEVMELMEPYIRKQAIKENKEAHEVKSVDMSYNQFFSSSCNTGSSSNLYAIVLADVKGLLEQIGKYDFETYAIYASKVSNFDKKQGSYQESVKLQEIENELKIILKNKPTDASLNFDML
ncbi:MAG TPA: patatin-like phospholipase family protein, partial [Candidatus Saccharimonadales bacterium]|nr:patatin-like phospholipase family protein [Candidatus Saccharimonadales bacterium]